MDDARAYIVRVNLQPCEGNGKLKSAGPGAAWVQKQHVAPRFDERFMRVPEDDRCDAGSFRIEIELLHVMEHVDAAAAKLD